VRRDLDTEARPRAPSRFSSTGAWVAIGLVAFLLLDAASRHFVAGNSDGATVVLEGQSLAKGHLLLHGWSLSLDSFWSVDAIFYGLGVLVVGVRASLLNVVPAIIAALVVCIGMKMARDNRAGLSAYVGPAIVFVVLAFPTPTMAYFFVQGPLHVATALWCLGAFFLLSLNRLGWSWALAVVLLAAGILGDLQTIALGVAPVFLAGLLAMARRRNWRAGINALGAALSSIVLAVILRAVATAIGTFSVGKINPLAPAPEMRENLRLLASRAIGLLGIGNLPGGLVPEPTIVQVLYVVALVVFVSGILVALYQLIRAIIEGPRAEKDAREPWRLDDMLVIAFIVDLVAFVALAYSTDATFARYLTAGIIFGTILAARTMGQLVGNLRSAHLSRAIAIAGVVLAVGFAASFGFSFTLQAPGQTATPLGAFLASHQLNDGVGDYWSSSIVTVETGGTVDVRPVICDDAGVLVRYNVQSEGSWYKGKAFHFLVYNLAVPWGNVDTACATTTFGPPTETYSVGTYRVLLWNHPIRFSSIGAH